MSATAFSSNSSHTKRDRSECGQPRMKLLASPSKRDINNSMRHAVRPFITEYKNRWSKSQAPCKRGVAEPELAGPKAPTVDVSAFAPPERQPGDVYHSALQAADAMFSIKPIASMTETPSSAPIGRVLPCLIQEERAAVALANGLARTTRQIPAPSKAQKKLPAETSPAPPSPAPAIAGVAIGPPPIQLSVEASLNAGLRRKRSVIQERWVRKTELKPGEKWKRRLHEAAR